MIIINRTPQTNIQTTTANAEDLDQGNQIMQAYNEGVKNRKDLGIIIEG